jgi:hypothetical protein
MGTPVSRICSAMKLTVRGSFAEVKSARDKVGRHQKGWFRIAKDLIGDEHQVRLHRVVLE